jgi:hypothetical protein
MAFFPPLSISSLTAPSKHQLTSPTSLRKLQMGPTDDRLPRRRLAAHLASFTLPLLLHRHDMGRHSQGVRGRRLPAGDAAAAAQVQMDLPHLLLADRAPHLRCLRLPTHVADHRYLSHFPACPAELLPHHVACGAQPGPDEVHLVNGGGGRGDDSSLFFVDRQFFSLVMSARWRLQMGRYCY